MDANKPIIHPNESALPQHAHDPIAYFRYPWARHEERYAPCIWLESRLRLQRTWQRDEQDVDYPVNRSYNCVYQDHGSALAIDVILFPDQSWGKPHWGKGSIIVRRNAGTQESTHVTELVTIINTILDQQGCKALTEKEYLR